MIRREELTLYLNKLLSVFLYKDYAPNGLQVEGSSTIKTICTAVTASAAVIHEAITLKADALLVHHGYFWKGEEAVICGIKKDRIASLLTNDINLFAYHLPLDCHPDLGNNACLARLFSVDAITKHRAGDTDNLLWMGNLSSPHTSQSLINLITEILGQSPLHITGNNKSIQKIAWCSGAAQDFIEIASILGADAYLSGEISERTFYQAKELGIHYFACGHHATEKYGVQALGKHVAAKFKLQHYFIDSENPI